MSNHLFDALLGAQHSDSDELIRLADGRTLTRGELYALCGRYANLLLERGVSPGDRVVAQVEA